WSFTNRKLQPVKAEDAERFFAQEAIQAASGFLKLSSLELLVDPACLGAGNLTIVEPFSEAEWKVAEVAVSHGRGCALGVTPSAPAASSVSDEADISNAVERFTKLRIQQRLEDTLDLPSMTPTTQKIAELRANPEPDVDELISVVKVDPSLSAQVMSWAASPYYAAPGKVASIDDAVVRVLGFELVVNMALGTAMGQLLTVPKDGPRGETPYWMQSVYAASLAEQICKKISFEVRPHMGLAYLSGLLHDFGYLVLANLFSPQFKLLSRYIEANPHLPLPVIEHQVLNVTRDQVAGWLLSSWSLPKEVCDGIRYQNNPEAAGEHEVYAKLMFITNRLLRERGLSDGPKEFVSDEMLESLGLTQRIVDDIADDLVKHDKAIRELTEILGRG
ncbi:MAG: HDOD domain-containing protein, partial [Pontibacterium sp.]